MKRRIEILFFLILSVVFLVTACGSDAGGEDDKSSTKAITSFGFESPATEGVIDEADHTIAVTVPYLTDVTALIPTVTYTGENISPASGIAQDFTNAVNYAVTAEDGSTQDYSVTVTIAASSSKEITLFAFSNPLASGEINEADHTISITVPNSTDVTSLIATFATTGVSVKVGGEAQISGTTANNFSDTVIYTVFAQDETSQNYFVTVVKEPSPEKAITEFEFTALDSQGKINETDHTIAVTVPYGTNLNGLIASFLTTGAEVSVNSILQVSGSTSNNFTSTVTYTVTAENGTSQNYTVTVTDYTPGLSYTLINRNTEYSVGKGSSDTQGKIVIPDYWNGIPVTAIDISGFDQCPEITAVYIPASVNSIGFAAFQSCSEIREINIPDGLTEISSFAFSGCRKMTILTIPDGVTSIGSYAFQGWDISTLTIPANVAFIGTYAFNNCKNLVMVYDGRISPPAAEDNVFINCSSLSSIRVPAGSVDAYKATAGWSTYASKIVAQ